MVTKRGTTRKKVVESPTVKIHCSILAEDAIKAAINDYQLKCTCV